MARRLKLTRFETQNVNFQYVGAYRLRVEATDPEGTGADPYVFLFQRRPVDPVTGAVYDVFLAVASPADMSEYPVGEPNDVTTYPIFRDDHFEIDLRALALLEEVWTIVVHDVTAVCRGLDLLDRLVPTAEVAVGDPPEAASASSSTSSSA